MSQAAQTTTVVTLGMVPTLAPGRIMALVLITAEVLWWSPSGIDRTTTVRDIGRATRTTCGNLDIGGGGTAKKFGSVATTPSEDIEEVTEMRLSAAVGDLEGLCSLRFK